MVYTEGGDEAYTHKHASGLQTSCGEQTEDREKGQMVGSFVFQSVLTSQSLVDPYDFLA